LRVNRTLLCIPALLASVLAAATAFAADRSGDALQAAIDSPSRTPQNVKRDVYRHPLQTLQFFAVRPDQTVVEIWPGRGWYMEILAPYLRDHGKYYGAIEAASPPGAPKEAQENAAFLRKRIAADPAAFSKVTLTELSPPQLTEICPPGSADVVLTFRNVHNWLEAGNAPAQFAAFYKALKPGGELGVVEHRAKPGTTLEQMKKSGYVDEALVKKLASDAGFRFVAASPVNNNPKDTKDYPQGVWTLPPSFALREQDRAKYQAIGESDRMTLKFVKPAS
jgi:predicted methyltransferase